MPSLRPRHLPRQRQPELEHDYSRPTSLGYEATEDIGMLRCLAHGFPTPLARWHFHDEYELHLITATSGKAFVGDWIGPFHPGHLVLCGPRLPHNWVSLDLPEGGVEERDLVIQFVGVSERAHAHWRTIKQARGLQRFGAFCEFMGDLARCTDYRLLSSVQMQSDEGDTELDRISTIVDRIAGDMATPLSAAQAAAELGLSESRFSRLFRRATGNTFTDFVNRVRVNRACHLLMETDRLVTHICYEVGFNNVANFNRRFLEIKGLTPSEYRRQTEHRFGRH
jgi:AraC-like DNA-binding protein